MKTKVIMSIGEMGLDFQEVDYVDTNKYVIDSIHLGYDDKCVVIESVDALGEALEMLLDGIENPNYNNVDYMAFYCDKNWEHDKFVIITPKPPRK